MGSRSNGLNGFVGRLWGEVKGPLYRNAFFLMLSTAIGMALGLLFWLIVFRVYRPSDAGFALALVQTLNFLAMLATLGLGIGLIRFLPETDNPPALVNTCLSIAGALGGALALAFALGVGIWAPQLSFILDQPIYIVVIVLSGMAFAFAPILDQTTVAMRRADLMTARLTIFAILKVPLPLLFVIWFTGPLGGRLGVYLSIFVAFGVSVLVSGFVFLPRLIPAYWPRPRLSRRRVKPMFTFSLGNWLATLIANGAVLLLPLLILNSLGSRGAESAAFFYAAVTVAGVLYIIPNATMLSLLAESSQQNAERRRDERKAVLLTVGLLVPGIIGIWLLAGPLLSLIGRPEYVTEGTGPLRVLTLASVPAFLNTLLGTRLRIRKKVWPLVAAASIEIAVALGLGYFLLLEFGLEGLAYAFVLSQAAATPLLWRTAGAPVDTRPSPGHGRPSSSAISRSSSPQRS